MGHQESPIQLRARFLTEAHHTAVCDKEPRRMREQLRLLVPGQRPHRRRHIFIEFNTTVSQTIKLIHAVGDTIADGEQREVPLSKKSMLKVYSILELGDSSWASHPWMFFRIGKDYDEKRKKDTFRSRGYGVDLSLVEAKSQVVATIVRSDAPSQRRVPESART